MTNSPTLSVLATQVGVILGTAAYMSPEQAKGLVADHRSDVFSFGAVLYEMLTGRQAFQADTPAETMAAVLMREPDFGALPSNLNPRLRELVQRCLEKQPKRRWQAAGDLRAEIATLMAAPQAVPAASSASAARPLWRRAIPFALTGILSAAIVGGSVWWASRPTTRPAVVRFSILLGEGQMENSAFRALDISPDGTHLVYATSGGLYLHTLSQAEAKPIAGAELGAEPTFSPDGQSIVFASADRTLRKVSVHGGPAVALCPIAVPFSISWTQDAIIVGQPTGIIRVQASGGAPETIVSLKPGERVHAPQLLPDGQTLLYALMMGTGGPADNWDTADIVAQSLQSGVRRTIIQGGSAARYLPSGHLLYALGATLYAVRFDPARLEVTGDRVPVVEGVGRSAATGVAQFAVSNSGSLVYLAGSSSWFADAWNLALLDDKGTLDVLKLPQRPYEFPRISPDGKQVAFGTNDGKEATIWIHDLDGSRSPRRLTFGGNNRYPSWSADGRRIAFQSDREGDLAIFSQRTDVPGARAERLTKPDPGTAHVPESWSRDADDDVFSYSVIEGVTATLWTFSVRDGKATPFSDIRSSSALNSEFSPDGNWIAYTLRGGVELATIYVEPFPATGARYLISSTKDLGHHPSWSPDGKTLFYVPGPQPLVGVSVATRPAFTFGNPQPWPGKLPNNNPYGLPRNYDITPDGRRFIFTTIASDQARSDAAPRQAQVVLNWLEELKTRVPR